MWAKYVNCTVGQPYTYSVRKTIMTLMNPLRVCSITCRGIATLSLKKGVSDDSENNSRSGIKCTKSNKRHSKEILDYFASKESLSHVLRLMPHKFLKRKKTFPDALYLVDAEVAKQVVSRIMPHITQEDSVLLEVNPGLGFVSSELLRCGFHKLQLYEQSSDFVPVLEDLQKKYSDDVTINLIDFFLMAKLDFQDKMDNGSRVNSILSKIPQRNWTDAPAMNIVGNMPTLSFLRYLVSCIVFQRGIILRGRPEMYITLPPSLYIHLTCGRSEGFMLYRSTTVIFQLFFEIELLEKISREAFFPWTGRPAKKGSSSKGYDVDPEYLYLVKIVPRKDLYENVVAREQLQPLWYFIRHHLLSRRNRIIPHLERWIPGCGPRVIVQGLDIFTQFGDLSPQELLALFKEFSSWPEFPHSPFLASMETSFMKMEQSSDEMDKEDELVVDGSPSDANDIEDESDSTSKSALRENQFD